MMVGGDRVQSWRGRGTHNITNCSRTHRAPGTKRITVVGTFTGNNIKLLFSDSSVHTIRLCLRTTHLPRGHWVSEAKATRRCGSSSRRMRYSLGARRALDHIFVIKRDTMSRVRPTTTLTRFNTLFLLYVGSCVPVRGINGVYDNPKSRHGARLEIRIYCTASRRRAKNIVQYDCAARTELIIKNNIIFQFALHIVEVT